MFDLHMFALLGSQNPKSANKCKSNINISISHLNNLNIQYLVYIFAILDSQITRIYDFVTFTKPIHYPDDKILKIYFQAIHLT